MQVVFHAGKKRSTIPHLHMKLPSFATLKIKGEDYATECVMKSEIKKLWEKTNPWSKLSNDEWWVPIESDNHRLVKYMFNESDRKSNSHNNIDDMIFV